MNEHDTVKLVNISTNYQPHLQIGDKGTIVHLYEDGGAYVVEFNVRGKVIVDTIFEKDLEKD